MTMSRSLNELSSPVHKLWKPELYKLQLEAPTPKPLLRTKPLSSTEVPSYYRDEYHGEMNHFEAEELLGETDDGTYLLRRSPNAVDYFTLSVRFNRRTKNFKIYYKDGEGHYLKEKTRKYYDSIHELVADGLVNFYMQLHAGPIIKQINQQTKSCYQQSPYMTLNRRKLRALSNELRKSIVAKGLPEPIGKESEAFIYNNNNNDNDSYPQSPSKDIDLDPILPTNYEKAHMFRLQTFKGLNFCEFCAHFLWGFTVQGMKCDACGFIAHTKCSELVPPKCLPDLNCIRSLNFGIDLTTMMQLHQSSIPFVVRRCVDEVEARGMLQEGIYRVSGFADEIENLKLAFERNGEKTDLSDFAYSNINVIAGTLKLYLRLLPVPLIAFQAYPVFMEATRNCNTGEQIKNLKSAAAKLPLAHFNCLRFMMMHLKKVASHYAVNKMNEQNLATVFAPTLIATPQHLTNLSEEILMLSLLITHCHVIFA